MHARHFWPSFLGDNFLHLCVQTDSSTESPDTVPDNKEALRQLIRRSRLKAASKVRRDPQVVRVRPGQKWWVRFLAPGEPIVWWKRRFQHWLPGARPVTCPLAEARQGMDIQCPVCDVVNELTSVTECAEGIRLLKSAALRRHWLVWVKVMSWMDETGQVFDESASACPWKFFITGPTFTSLEALVREHHDTPLSIFDPRVGLTIQADRNSDSESILLRPCEPETLFPLDAEFDHRVQTLTNRCQWPDFGVSAPEELRSFARQLERRIEIFNQIERNGGDPDF